MPDITKIVLSKTDRRLFNEIRRKAFVPVGESYEQKYFPLLRDEIIEVAADAHTTWGTPVNPRYVISNFGHRFITYERDRRRTRILTPIFVSLATNAILIASKELWPLIREWLSSFQK